jgi:hypothetical protein
MRVWSDLHLEFGAVHAARANPPAPLAGEIVILAGDIAVGTAGVLWAARTFPNNDVAYVLGNHELYHADIDITIRACRDAAAGTNVRVLERDVWDVTPGTRILGATLWTDYGLWPECSLGVAYAEARRLADHRLVSIEGRTFSPADAHRRHLDTRVWLEAELLRAADEGVRTIVVTHHAPHTKCLGRDFQKARDPFSTAFASDLAELLHSPIAPAVWVSGHTHRNYVGRLGKTRLVSNQGGYAFRTEEKGFDLEGLVF